MLRPLLVGSAISTLNGPFFSYDNGMLLIRCSPTEIHQPNLGEGLFQLYQRHKLVKSSSPQFFLCNLGFVKLKIWKCMSFTAKTEQNLGAKSTVRCLDPIPNALSPSWGNPSGQAEQQRGCAAKSIG